MCVCVCVCVYDCKGRCVGWDGGIGRGTEGRTSLFIYYKTLQKNLSVMLYGGCPGIRILLLFKDREGETVRSRTLSGNSAIFRCSIGVLGLR